MTEIVNAVAPLPQWRVLFNAALDAAGGNRQVVADQLDLSRTTVSLVAADKYPGRLDKFARRVLDTYDRYTCPHLGEPITGKDCKTFALRPVPTSSAREARHWRACQACPYKPNPKAQEVT